MKNPAIQFEAPASAYARWNPNISAEIEADETAINIYDQIGADPFTGAGMTAKIVSKVMRDADGEDIYVNINSPGGDFFEGLAIYNLLNEYSGRVHVRVLGMAASAASIVALAGDEIEIGENAFFMIHNAWTIRVGNKDDFKETAKMLAKFDSSMLELYVAKTGMEASKITKMMADETWISGKESIEMGFSTKILGDEKISEDENDQVTALRKIDIALAKAEMPRSERRKLIKEITGTPRAAEDPTPRAGFELISALESIEDTLKS